jgi:hypothetical protein
MSDSTTVTLERIHQKLGQLRTLDAECKLFGANSHRYRLGRALTEVDLASFERQLGVALPLGYRRFLAGVGHGGAGPYYGLFAIDSRDEENITSIGQLSKPFRWTDEFNPGEWKNPCEEEGAECDEDGEFWGISLPGALYLCHYGCALRFFLVVSGQCTGEVWHDWQADEAGIYPATDNEGRRVGFLEWYEQWLDKSLAEF